MTGVAKQFYEPKVNLPTGLIDWKNISPKSLEIAVARGIKMIVLGIETSCDETAAAVCKDGKIISNIVSRQVIHSKFGGVVPELASREHEILLNKVVHEAIKKANINLKYLDAVAVTQGPGLNGTLLTGICFAKGLALDLKYQ